MHEAGPSGGRAALVALALMVGNDVDVARGEPPLPPRRPPELAPAAPSGQTLQSPPPAPSEGEPAECLAKLLASGVRAEAAAPQTSSAEGCGINAPVRLSSITALSGDVVSLPDQPLVDCAFAAVLADYVRLVVAPLGEAMLHAKVAAIETGPGYECRTQDRIAGAKISAHAKGLAVDFVAISFADKRRLLIERPTGADESSYFRVVRTAACGWFTTVLGPGADAFHANNMHLDIEQHGASASYRICE